MVDLTSCFSTQLQYFEGNLTLHTFDEHECHMWLECDFISQICPRVKSNYHALKRRHKLSHRLRARPYSRFVSDSEGWGRGFISLTRHVRSKWHGPGEGPAAGVQFGRVSNLQCGRSQTLGSRAALRTPRSRAQESGLEMAGERRDLVWARARGTAGKRWARAAAPAATPPRAAAAAPRAVGSRVCTAPLGVVAQLQ